MRARRAALGAALRALRSNVTAEGAGEGSAGRPAAQFRPLSVAGAVGVASQGSGGVILCLSWSDIEAQGAAEALSLYQARAQHSTLPTRDALDTSPSPSPRPSRCCASAATAAPRALPTTTRGCASRVDAPPQTLQTHTPRHRLTLPVMRSLFACVPPPCHPLSPPHPGTSSSRTRPKRRPTRERGARRPAAGSW